MSFRLALLLMLISTGCASGDAAGADVSDAAQLALATPCMGGPRWGRSSARKRHWPAYRAPSRMTMTFDVEPHLAAHPRDELRAHWSGYDFAFFNLDLAPAP